MAKINNYKFNKLNYNTSLSPAKLTELLAKAEEFLTMIVEYDPVEERSKNVCITIRVALEWYTQMQEEKSGYICDDTNMETESDLPEEENELNPHSTNVDSDSPETEAINLKETDENVYIAEGEVIINEAPLAAQTEDDNLGLMQYGYFDENIVIKSEPLEENTDIDQTSSLNEYQSETMEDTLMAENSCFKDEENYHNCKICGYKTKHRKYLLRHIMGIHEKIRPFKCTLCSYASAFKPGLKQHMLSAHSESKPFKCTKCPMEFCRNHDLRSHVLSVHEKVKPFECTICKFRFARKTDLKRHTLGVHDKIKAYKCLQCSYECAHKAHLKKHILARHEKNK